MLLYLYTLTVHKTVSQKEEVSLVSDKNNDIKTETEADFRREIRKELKALFLNRYGYEAGSHSISCKTIPFHHYLTWKLGHDTKQGINHFVE